MRFCPTGRLLTQDFQIRCEFVLTEPVLTQGSIDTAARDAVAATRDAVAAARDSVATATVTAALRLLLLPLQPCEPSTYDKIK